MSLSVKTISSRDIDEFDKLVTRFNLQHIVRYSQSHTNIIRNIGGEVMIYTMVIFYEDWMMNLLYCDEIILTKSKKNNKNNL